MATKLKKMWRGNIKNLHNIISSSAQSRETIPLSRHIENEKTILCSHFYGPLWNEMSTFSPIFMGHLENEMTWHLDLAPLFKAIFKIKAAIIMGPLENEMATLTRPLYGHLENEPTTFSRIFYGPCWKLNDNI